MTKELYQVYSKFPTPHGGEILLIRRFNYTEEERYYRSEGRRSLAKVKYATRARFGQDRRHVIVIARPPKYIVVRS